jgi:hypothetical protein
VYTYALLAGEVGLVNPLALAELLMTPGEISIDIYSTLGQTFECYLTKTSCETLFPQVGT